MIQLVAMSTIMLGACPPENDFSVAAVLPASRLDVGRTYDLIVTVDVAGELESSIGSGEGTRTPLLFIDAPKSVRLLERAPKQAQSMEDFQKQFFDRPYGRRLLNKESRIKFKLRREPEPGEVFGLNVITYLDNGGGRDARFVRRRLHLSVTANATAVEVSADVTNWGRGKTLQVGDKVSSFAVVRADGSRFVLREHIGTSNILLMKYRRDT